MSDFADLADAGAALAPVLHAAIADVPDPLVLAVLPNGAPVAVGLRSAWPGGSLEVRALAAARSDDGVVVGPHPGAAGRHVVVVDDGVETGTVARAAAAALRGVGVASLTLAVPVCSREVQADLDRRYDRVVAVVRPIARRRLAWHYADFDAVDDATARRLLAAQPRRGPVDGVPGGS